MKSTLLSVLLSALLAFILGASVATFAEERFKPPKSDAPLEFLLDLLGGIFHFDLDQLSQARVVSNQVVAQNDQVTHHVITLKNDKLGEVRLFVREPNKEGSFPTLFISPGFHSDPRILSEWALKEDVVLVQMEYPFNDHLRGGKLVYEVLRRSVKIQLLSAVAMNWVRQQSFVKAQKISLVNVSFGTFVAPLSVRIAQLLGLDPYAVVFAYGGSDLKSLIVPFVKEVISEADYENIKKPLSRLLELSAPARHLSHLQTQTGYLVVNGISDQIIPKESKDVLIQNLPDPVTVIDLEGGHVNLDHPDLIKKAIDVTYSWLKDQGAFN